MLKLLIADDETLIREGLASLEWEEHGLEVVATAENGEEALELAKRHRPDIIMTDIRMPRRDGIWLAQSLQTHLPEARVVFITSYSDFDYAKKAIEYGVASYILKPIEEDLLYETIDGLRNSIEEERFERQESEKFKNAVAESKQFLKSWFLNRFSNSEKKFRFFGLAPQGCQYDAIVVTFQSESMSEIESNAFLMFEKITYTLKKEREHLVPFYDGNIFTFIFQFSGEMARPEVETRLFVLADKIKQYLDETDCENYSVGIGFVETDIYAISSCYDSACAALSYTSYLGQNQVIYIKDFEENIKSGYTADTSLEYINAIKAGDETASLQILDHIFESGKTRPLDDLKRVCLELIVHISKAITEIGEDPKILFHNTDSWSVINRCADSKELYDLVSGVNQVVISRLNEIRNNKNSAIVARVKKIVKESYAETASLDSIATQIFLSPCYLSVIFSKEMNMTFKDYLIQTRIEKAKELILTTNLKIYEIAKKVGYNDARYFSDLFRRVTGKTPSQFRTDEEAAF